MKSLILGVLVTFSIFGSTSAFAQSLYEDELSIALAALPKVKGLVRRINTANSTIYLKHEYIPNLDMPAMTMWYPVRDPSMLNGLAAGDRVLFSAEEINGEATIVWIE